MSKPTNDAAQSACNYYILNTNRRYGIDHENGMLSDEKAAAYTEEKKKIDRIQKGDKVFLYGNEVGIVAKGIATGNRRMKKHASDPMGEYYQVLSEFENLSQKPISLKKLKEIGIPILQHTLYSILPEKGKQLWVAQEEEAI